MSLLKGIDVSGHQHMIDWPTVARSGVSFAWIKASQGSTRADLWFPENWSGALFAGISRGAYHFMTDKSSAREQAELFLRIYPGGGELPPALDLEIDPDDGSCPSPEAAIVWLWIVEGETGVRPIVYTSPSFADEHQFAEYAFGSYDLWLANYGVKVPRVPRPWKDWRAWQTGKGSVPGIRGDVDLDVMRAWT